MRRTQGSDFGRVKNSDKQHHEFVVTNEGTATLEILDVKPGCRCTPAGAVDRHVAPRKTGKVPIEFNPINFTGPVSKSITATCNDRRSTQQLTIKALVWAGELFVCPKLLENLASSVLDVG